MRSDGFLLSGRFFIPMGPEHRANMARTLSPGNIRNPQAGKGVPGARPYSVRVVLWENNVFCRFFVDPVP